VTRLVSPVQTANRLKYVVSLRRSRVDGDDNDRPYVGLEQIEAGTGRFIRARAEVDENLLEPVGGVGESLSNTFEIGDVLFGKLRPYLAKVWVAEFPGRCTTELLVMEPRSIQSCFLRYVCLSRDFIDAVDASTFGSKMPRADWDFIGNMPVPLPGIASQAGIANYLDRETERLRALAEAKERLVALLIEKRQALITKVVTRGLDPAAPVHDSGIPWLGKIPTHWKLKRAKWLFRERDERSTTGEETLLSLRMERGLVPHNEVSEKQTRPEELIGYKKVAPTEIVLNRMRAASGLVAVSQQSGLVSPDYAIFQSGPEVEPNYFTHLFKTELLQCIFRSESTGLGTGSSGFLRLYSENFLALWLPCPPLQEQRRIVNYITEQSAKIARLADATNKTISLLKERRSALITAGVKGQIEVGNAA